MLLLDVSDQLTVLFFFIVDVWSPVSVILFPIDFYTNIRFITPQNICTSRVFDKYLDSDPNWPTASSKAN